ncbi:TetR/AcrR family transcriptional regulator [Tepidibacter hydrothermalis]|uniref:TetR/AcrR family transcriptional regulator n=1 Tax=Tepidibacter hydrothermalis TaxID=3036126 RepID=A0ABY8E7F2_9FIRM|nr:TetR/AcrR family transcriptional regulator [Tepidibacter hydrothermalis]WFD08825.1 TetR/AcrR family transcriptional regulator [Tepidibacter hydrothermalis]
MESRTSKTRKKILEAAIEEFAQKGFSATTTLEIAQRAQVAEVTLFRHFPKKKDILHFAVLDFVDVFTGNFAFNSLKVIVDHNKHKPIKEILKLIILDRREFLQEYFPYIKVIFQEMQFDEEVRTIYLEKIAKQVSLLFSELFSEIKEREKIKNIDSFILMRSFIGMAFMMIMQRYFIPSENKFEDFDKEIDIVVDIFLNGILDK